MAFEHTVLITAAGGNIGTELVPLLLSANMKLVLPTSNASRLQSKLPSGATASNVAVEEGSISEPQWIEAILKKHQVDTVFLCLTGTDELMTTLNFFDAMERAGTVKNLVYLSACGDFVSQEGVQRLMRICSAAHVVVKSTIEQKLTYASFPWQTTRIGPTLFFSNDLRSKTSMLEHGLFDEPLHEKGVSRVATSDIALAVKNVIVAYPKYAGQKIMVGSRKTYTGTEVAGLWSQATGKEIRVFPCDVESMNKFEDQFAEKTGRKGDWARDLRLMYEIFGKEKFGMSEEEYKVLVEVLGKEAKDYEGWVAEVGESWK